MSNGARAFGSFSYTLLVVLNGDVRAADDASTNLVDWKACNNEGFDGKSFDKILGVDVSRRRSWIGL